ncbi:MAG: 30S ribosomal protein S12 methylthiotransferase RimO [Bacteroidaceae bacterium]|nr:30S ribosomal protein S12 methylthiotransferase RimO [Bacteroidaceae bacterium]
MHAIDLYSLGCSKNLVDSEKLLYLFKEKGYTFHHNPAQLHGDIAVVNTCGFIADAKEESIGLIFQLCQAKAEGRLKRVYVMGCMAERYRHELEDEIPEVDGFFGKFDWPSILEALEPVSSVPVSCGARVLTTPSHYAYLKISEGCDRTCAYCAIPLITGRHRSRPEEEILDEVRWLVAQGVSEFNVIAQELTYYGVDLYGGQRLPQLIEKMAHIEGVRWIRLHYGYPTHFPFDLTRVMRENNNVCRYLDIALQHISDPVLSRMRRHTTKEETLRLIRRLREEVPGICLRTTLMVGFPGETEEDFRELCDFVREARFERMGAFAYSEEEGTYAAAHYTDDVPDDVKQARLSILMRIQERISAEVNAALVGQERTVIIDRLDGDYYVGRTEHDSPEVDCEVLIPADEWDLEVGQFYDVRISAAEDFDLYAHIID